jgi:hypothetical protein
VQVRVHVLAHTCTCSIKYTHTQTHSFSVQARLRCSQQQQQQQQQPLVSVSIQLAPPLFCTRSGQDHYRSATAVAAAGGKDGAAGSEKAGSGPQVASNGSVSAAEKRESKDSHEREGSEVASDVEARSATSSGEEGGEVQESTGIR